MAKRHKNHSKQSGKSERRAGTQASGLPAASAAGTRSATVLANPPAKNPSLLGVSILLFALWFIFLLVTALLG